MSFDKDIRKFNKKFDRGAEQVLRRSVLIIFSSVIKRTPVKTGALRANWQLGINEKPTGTVTSGGKVYGSAIGPVKAGTDGAKIGDTLYLVNNLPYAQVIENGSSKQAPHGMVKLAVAEWDHTVAVQALRNRR